MRNKIVTLLILLLFILGISIFVLPQKESSFIERRKLSTRENVTLNNMVSSVNSIMNDQFVFREQSILAINMIKHFSNAPFNQNLLKIKDNAIKLDNESYINDFIKLKEEDKKTALNRAYNIQQISERYPKIKTYIYFPTRIEETTLLDSDKIQSVYSDLREEFISQLGENVKTSELKLNSIDDYKKYFYKTDHHWNGEGVHQGYKDIVKMIAEDFDIGNVKEIKIDKYNYDFYGSYAQKVAFMCNPDNLINMSVETPSYKYYVDGNQCDDEVEIKNYIKNGNVNQLYTDYELAYGSNNYERIYDFNQQDKPNILIFTDSFINPIKKALASHFNKTVIIDMRADKGLFNLDKYIKKYNIDIILFLQYYEDLYFNGYLFVPLD